MEFQLPDCRCVDHQRGVEVVQHILAQRGNITLHLARFAMHCTGCEWCRAHVRGIWWAMECASPETLGTSPEAFNDYYQIVQHLFYAAHMHRLS